MGSLHDAEALQTSKFLEDQEVLSNSVEEAIAPQPHSRGQGRDLDTGLGMAVYLSTNLRTSTCTCIKFLLSVSKMDI